jgi:hypothetical protein
LAIARATAGAGGAELGGMARSVVAIARRVGMNPARAATAFGELDVTGAAVASGTLPPVGTRVRFDGFTYQRYEGEGLRFQPLATFWFARDTARHGNVTQTRRLLDAGLRVGVRTGGATHFEYLFPWQGGRPPWSSPMAGALAMDAYARGFRLTGDPRYRDAALAIERDVVAHGVEEAGDLWYPMYPFAPSLHILNGHLQVALGLLAVSDLAPDAAGLALRAAETAARRLPLYDTGAWSNYLPGTEAKLAYHDLQTAQLEELGRLTQITALDDAAARFAAYRASPPEVAPIGTPDAVYSAPGGVPGSTAVRFSLDKWAAVTVTIRSRDAGVIETRSLGLLHRGAHAFTWRPAGLPPGTYLVTFSATDLAGNTGTGTDAAVVTLVARRR